MRLFRARPDTSDVTTATFSARRARAQGMRVQTMIMFLAAALLALTVLATLATRAHASISCTTKSIAATANRCQNTPAGNAAPVANVTFVFER